MDALSRTFLLILKKVAFNQAVFSGRKIIPQTSKPGSDTNMAPGQKGIWQGAKRPHRTVPIPEALMDELRAQLERVIDLLHKTSLQKAIRKAVKNMDIQRFHDFMRIELYESLRIKTVQISITPEPLNHEPVNGYAGSLRVWFLSSESLFCIKPKLVFVQKVFFSILAIVSAYL